METGTVKRFTLWNFGGVAVVHDAGFLWYQKSAIDAQDTNTYLGTYLARVSIKEGTDKTSAHRYPGMLFGPDEPRMGTMSCLAKDGYIYLWGERPGDQDIILGRVREDNPEFRDEYTFWTGQEWSRSWEDASSVLHDVPQGGFFESKVFGPQRPFVFIGVSRWATSKLLIGAAKDLEGPWDLTEVAEAQGIDYDEGYKYCIYPHSWALDEEKGELMISCSEHWPGGVVAMRLRFRTEHEAERGEGQIS